MCLIAFAWHVHPRYRLVLAGNRDEYHARPSAALQRWPDFPQLVAGKDLELGGTWLGVTDDGRAGVVTNVRNPQAPQDGISRGFLLTEYLLRGTSAREFSAALAPRAADFRPFNLLLFDTDNACYVGNQPSPERREVGFGVKSISNGYLDSDWPKTRRLSSAVSAWLKRDDAPLEELFAPLADETLAPDAELPGTGVGLQRERMLSPAFIRGEIYGTRASTILALDAEGRGLIIERRFGPGGTFAGESRETLGRT